MGPGDNPDECGVDGPGIVRYPYAVGILCAALDPALEIINVPDAELNAAELALLRVRRDGEWHEVVVDNEYGDAEGSHRALLLVLILQALRWAEETPDFLEWWLDLGREVSKERLVGLHRQLLYAAEDLLPIYRSVTLPGDYEWSLNAGGAQALRRLAAGEMTWGTGS